MKCLNCDISKKETEFYIKERKTGRRSSWCKKCTLNLQKKRWRDRKTKVVELMGGQCENCGYDQNYAALDLHHTDPNKKEFIFRELIGRPWNVVIAEIKKCELLCKNCHASHHNPQWNKSNVEIASTHAKNLDDRRPIYKNASECPTCKQPAYGTKYCSSKCSKFAQRKVKSRPTKTKLFAMRKNMSICAIGREFGVSDNAVRKWMK